MFLTNTFSFLLLAVAPLSAQAQHNQQIPLQEQGSELTVPLSLNGGETYSFQSGEKRFNLREVQEAVIDISEDIRPHIVTIHIPIDSTQPGSMVIGHEASLNHLSPAVEWIDTTSPGENMSTFYVGIRMGGMMSKDVHTTRLALNTPYISISGEIYDILIMATTPTSWQRGGSHDYVVDCQAIGRYPDIVLGLEPGVEGEEGEEGEADEVENDEDVKDREIVITPRQYVMEVEEGKCVLLVKKINESSREEVVLGWAALRGRAVVLDWMNRRTGFEV